MSMYLVIPALWGDSISTTKEFSYLQELFSFLSLEQPFPSSVWPIPFLNSTGSVIVFTSVYSFMNSVNLDSLKEHIKSSSHATWP